MMASERMTTRAASEGGAARANEFLRLSVDFNRTGRSFDLCGWYEPVARAKNRHDVYF